VGGNRGRFHQRCACESVGSYVPKNRPVCAHGVSRGLRAAVPVEERGDLLAKVSGGDCG
jgi:hypothetical protein